MFNYFSIVIRKYLANYAGLSSKCWQRVGFSFFNELTGGICFFLSFYFVKVLHLDITVSGFIVSCYAAGTVVGGYVGGKLSDKVSATVVSLVSLFIKACAFFALVFLQDVHFLITFVFLVGLSTYSFKTANNAWILKHCEESEAHRLKAINIIYTVSNLALSLSAALVGLFGKYGFQNIFFLWGILLLGTITFLAFQERRFTFFHDEQTESVVEEKNDTSPQSGNKKSVWLVLGCVFGVGLIIAQLGTTYSIYLHDVFPSYGLSGVSFLFILNCLLVVFLQTPLVNRFDKANKLLMVGVGAFLYGFGMFLLSFPFSFAVAIISCLIYTFGEMLFIAMAQLVCYQNGNKKRKGHALGLFQSVFALSVVVGPTVGGFIYYNWGGYWVWYLSGLIGLICLVMCSYKGSTSKVGTSSMSASGA